MLMTAKLLQPEAGIAWNCQDALISHPGEWELYIVSNGFLHSKDEETYATRNECEARAYDLLGCGKIRSHLCAIKEHR
jgi:hypothetical protein